MSFTVSFALPILPCAATTGLKAKKRLSTRQMCLKIDGERALFFLLGKIQKGGGVSTRAEAFFGSRYFIQSRGKSLQKFLKQFYLFWCSFLLVILLEAYFSNVDLFPSLARRRFCLVTLRSSPTYPSSLGEACYVSRQKRPGGRLPIFQGFNLPQILGHSQFLSSWSNSLYLLSFSY